MAFTVKLEVDLSALHAFVKDVKRSRGVIEEAWYEIARVYRAAMLRRYRVFSRGGGTWIPLSPVTIAAKGSSVILVDTGLLIASMNPAFVQGNPVNIVPNRLGVNIGFSSIAHSASEKSSTLTIADIASFHQLGRGVPMREILVKPDDTVMNKFAQIMERAMKRRAEGDAA